MDPQLTPEQQLVADEIIAWAKNGEATFMGLSGAAGTGKTFLLRFLKSAFKEGYPGGALWSAMTGKAALRLSELAGVAATTFHKVFYEAPEDKPGAPSFSVVRDLEEVGVGLLVVDEASMMGPDVFSTLKNNWGRQGVKILLVGDGFQLPPVMSKQEERDWGTDFSVFAEVPTVSLKTVMRSTSDVLWAATQIREHGVLPKESRGAYSYLRTPSVSTHAADKYGGVGKVGPPLGLITWRNEIRMRTNAMIRSRVGRGDNPEPGEPILACKNGYGRMNGEVVKLTDLSYVDRVGDVVLYRMVADDGRLSLVTISGNAAFMDGGQPFLEREAWNTYRAALRKRNWFDPVPITWGYVLTAHKAQGSEFDEVVVFLTERDTMNPAMFKQSALPDGKSVPFWRRWIYTALTRAKTKVSIVVGGE